MKKLTHIITILILTAVIISQTFTVMASETAENNNVTYTPALLEVKTENYGGQQYLIKDYVASPDDDPDVSLLIEEPFEYEGFLYTFNGFTINEIMSEEKVWERTEVNFPIAEDDVSLVYEKLAPTVEYSKDGFYGWLELDYKAVWTQAEGYAKKSFTMTDSVTMNGLSSNDSSNIPKTRVKSGVTMQLQSVDWSVQESTTIGYDTIPTKYTAVAKYSGSYSKEVPTGYIGRALYGGYVTKLSVDRVIYSVTYTGQLLATPEPKPVPTPNLVPEPTAGIDTEPSGEAHDSNNSEKPDEKGKSPVVPIVVITVIVLILAGAAAFLLLYWFNVGIYTGDKEDYLRIGRRHIKVYDPVIDLRRMEIVSGDLSVEIKKRTAAELFGRQIQTLISDDFTHRCIVEKRDDDFWYTITIPGDAGREDGSEA